MDKQSGTAKETPAGRARYTPGSKQTEQTAERREKYTPGSKQAEYDRAVESVRDDMPETGRERSKVSEKKRMSSAHRQRKYRKVLIGIGAVLAVVYIALAVYYGFHFYSGTEFYGIDCGNKTAEQVKNEAVEKLDRYELTISERDDQTETVSAHSCRLCFRTACSLQDLRSICGCKCL